jgi:hypothetical protein
MASKIGPTNGGRPARLATIAEILAASETEVALPALSATVGEPCVLKIRKLARAEFLLCLPPSPPGSDSWAREDWPANEAAWIETLEPDVLEARRRTLADLNVKLVAMAVLDPALSLDQARRLGDDALVVAAEILRFSGITSEATTVEPVADPAVSVSRAAVEPAVDPAV